MAARTKGLDTSQLRYLARHDRRLAPHFLGVFPADRLPTVFSRPAGLIVNSDRSREPGTHWLAMYFGDDEQDEFFDSYGQLPPAYQASWTARLRPGYRHNTRTLQGPRTTVCGHYCYYYLAQRFRGKSLGAIVNTFPGPPALNDRLVCHWVTRTPQVRRMPQRSQYCQTSVCRQHRRGCSQ